MKKEKVLIALAAGVGVAAVTYGLINALSKDIPDGAVPVHQFDMLRYLGTWNEIARLPNRIEKNLKYLTETYSDNRDGSYKVITRAYNVKKNEWKEATGTIKFAGEEDMGMLKVSYLRPFYASYNVIDLDPSYRYALVSGSGLDYLWILSKGNDIPAHVRARFLDTAAIIGFDINQLEWA